MTFYKLQAYYTDIDTYFCRAKNGTLSVSDPVQVFVRGKLFCNLWYLNDTTFWQTFLNDRMIDTRASCVWDVFSTNLDVVNKSNLKEL